MEQELLPHRPAGPEGRRGGRTRLLARTLSLSPSLSLSLALALSLTLASLHRVTHFPSIRPRAGQVSPGL